MEEDNMDISMNMTNPTNHSIRKMASAVVTRVKSMTINSPVSSKSISQIDGMERNHIIMPRCNSTSSASGVEMMEGSINITINLVGAIFTCLVEKDWPCKSILSSAISTYHQTYPDCEIPSVNVVYHITNKVTLDNDKIIGRYCKENDTIELQYIPIAKPSKGTNDTKDKVKTSLPSQFDFTIMFHTLPLGFTLKQQADGTVVVAKVYPNTAAKYYEPNLIPGTIILSIGESSVQRFCLRQAHTWIKNAVLPLKIQFRRPSSRSKRLFSRFSSGSSKEKTKSQQSKSGITPPPKTWSNTPSSRKNGSDKVDKNTTWASTVARPRSLTQLANEVREHPNDVRHSLGKNRKSNEHQHQMPPPDRSSLCESALSGMSDLEYTPSVCGSSVSRQKRNSLYSENDFDTSQEVDAFPQDDTELNDEKYDVERTHDQEDTESDFTHAHNEHQIDEEDGLLVAHIETLKAKLAKKQREAEDIAKQLEKYNNRLMSKDRRLRKSVSGTSTVNSETHNSTSTRSAITSTNMDKNTVRLTPEALQAMDSTSNAKQDYDRAYYASSNMSCVSGYSNHSTNKEQSGPPSSYSAPRHRDILSAKLSRVTVRGDYLHSDVLSVASSCSNSSNRADLLGRSGSFSGNLRIGSSRGQSYNPLLSQERFSFTSKKYHTNDLSKPPSMSSLSSKGAVISRAKVSRDSYITKSESPGVGAYDVKIPEKVKGGEIGDSDRNLW